MIKIENVNKYFNRFKKNKIHVINNTSLEFGSNGLIALLGPSGCGKTTLLNTISGIDKVNSGKIYINGKRITKKRSYYVDKVRNLNIGYIFQDYNLINNMTVFENVSLVLKINGIKNKEEIKKRVDYCLEKVGMYRYRNRYASMLSGGEKQRVAIARAIVKNPSIIIADEPTGNLDSKNTIEIMNIIKAISKNKLVLLVTHEKQIAEFYASRIIEISDGKVINDRINEHNNDLDYKLDNKIYLKDFSCIGSLINENIEVNYYTHEQKIPKLDIVYQNGNIYIKSEKNIEIVNDDSVVTFVNDNYKKITKDIYENYEFDIDKISSTTYKYSSVFNIFNLIVNGFKKVRNYTLVKKLLLIGFFASGLFITNSISNAFGITDIKDEDFVSINKNYISVINKKINVDDFKKYEKNELVNYIIPGDSNVSFRFEFDDYYQTQLQSFDLTGSLITNKLLETQDIVYGKYPQSENEIILDILTAENFIKNTSAKQVGIFSYKDLLNRKIKIQNMDDFVIVGFTDKKDPSIYTDETNFINIIYNSIDNYEYNYMYNEDNNFIDYNLVKNNIKLTKGKYPENDYEVILSNNYKDEYKLNSKINTKINDTKLKVVGFYDSADIYEKMLVSNNTIKYDLITKKEGLSIYSNNNEELIENLLSNGFNASSSYETSKNSYIKEKQDQIKSSLIACLIILLISVIEIYLMIRSSFLSRIKEVGVYRVIGMKKSDIRKMFVGEIIAITTLGSLPGCLFMTFIIKQITKIEYFNNSYLMNSTILLIVVTFIYIFNIFVGLLPVNKILKNTPAEILSRNDI